MVVRDGMPHSIIAGRVYCRGTLSAASWRPCSSYAIPGWLGYLLSAKSVPPLPTSYVFCQRASSCERLMLCIEETALQTRTLE